MYAEIKIRFADKSAHVTHLCKGCIPKVRKDEEALMAIYNADIDDMCTEDPKCERFREKESPKVVAVDLQARGIR
jgi:hypothetical protein